jgi:NAD-dependent dihydropyrimidine dehydrogenase PreA subunit
LKRARRHWVPVAPLPPDAPPLREVVAQLVIKNRQLGDLDNQVARALAEIERVIRERRPIGHPVDVPFPPWGKLGWSGRRGHLRLVVLDDDDCEDLAAMPQRCRVDACHVIGKLVERLSLPPAR